MSRIAINDLNSFDSQLIDLSDSDLHGINGGDHIHVTVYDVYDSCGCPVGVLVVVTYCQD